MDIWLFEDGRNYENIKRKFIAYLSEMWRDAFSAIQTPTKMPNLAERKANQSLEVEYIEKFRSLRVRFLQIYDRIDSSIIYLEHSSILLTS